MDDEDEAALNHNEEGDFIQNNSFDEKLKILNDKTSCFKIAVQLVEEITFKNNKIMVLKMKRS